MAKSNLIKVIVIDANKRQVREEKVPNELESLQKIVGGMIETAVRTENDIIYVDEEGLLKPMEYGFIYEGAHQPFAGNGVVTGVDDEGESVDTTFTVESVKEKVRFL